MSRLDYSHAARQRSKPVTDTKNKKPLNKRAYGSIPHLPGSRLGPNDTYIINEGQARILTEKRRDGFDTIVVQEKLDGSCVAVAKVNGEIIPLIRAGYKATDSPHAMHHLFHEWAMAREGTFKFILEDGERLVGEWLAQAHGTKYAIKYSQVFAPFDIMRGDERLPHDAVLERVMHEGFWMPPLLHVGGPLPPSEAMQMLGERGFFGAEKPEGVVYRCERNGRVEFLAKFVRQDYQPGCYLLEFGGTEDVWNWHPDGATH